MMLHEGLLCLHLLLALLVDHILFIDLEVRAITGLGKILGLRLAMLDDCNKTNPPIISLSFFPSIRV